MNRYRLVLLFLALTGTLLSGSVKAGLLDDYPQEASPFVLSTGEEVYLPLHVSNLWGMAIIGTIDLDEASAGMNAQNLYPIEVGNNKGLAIVYVLDYREAGLGPYQEIITLIAVTSDAKASVAENLIGFGSSYFPKLKEFLEGDMPDTGVYFERISLDSTLAITTGIEIWGIPKTYEQLSIENTFWKTSVATSEVNFQLNKEFGLFTPLQLNLTSWTPMDYEQTRAETLLKGWGRMGLVGSNDTFELGDNLSRLDFTPVVWQEILPGTDAVFFEGAVPDLLEISE